MRLGPNGEIIATNGFDGGEYAPRYADRTSTYLGDMSKEDMRVRDLVRVQNLAIARENAAAIATKRLIERQKMVMQDRMKQQIQAREIIGQRITDNAKMRGYEAARRDATSADYNPWVGSAFAGFGQEGEQRINPDSAEDVNIVDANIASVREYGIGNWMEDPESLIERVDASATGYTEGKQVMATMVDYAQSSDLSVVGMPLASEVSRELESAEAAVGPIANAVAAQSGTSPSMVKFGMYALAAYFLLRR